MGQLNKVLHLALQSSYQNINHHVNGTVRQNLVPIHPIVQITFLIAFVFSLQYFLFQFLVRFGILIDFYGNIQANLHLTHSVAVIIRYTYLFQIHAYDHNIDEVPPIYALKYYLFLPSFFLQSTLTIKNYFLADRNKIKS